MHQHMQSDSDFPTEILHYRYYNHARLEDSLNLSLQRDKCQPMDERKEHKKTRAGDRIAWLGVDLQMLDSEANYCPT